MARMSEERLARYRELDREAFDFADSKLPSSLAEQLRRATHSTRLPFARSPVSFRHRTDRNPTHPLTSV